jgi:hypothetical protein
MGWWILVFYPGPFNIKSFLIICNSNITSFFRFVDKRAIYRRYNLIRTCAGECD